jgi:hypothetical protein
LATRAKGYGKVKVSEPGCVERTSWRSRYKRRPASPGNVFKSSTSSLQSSTIWGIISELWSCPIPWQLFYSPW